MYGFVRISLLNGNEVKIALSVVSEVFYDKKEKTVTVRFKDNMQPPLLFEEGKDIKSAKVLFELF